MIKIDAELKGFLSSSTPDQILNKYNLQTGGKAQQVLDKSVIDWCLQYCPWETGSLAKSAYAATTIGSGKVIYPGPYARYLYYGEVMGPNIPVFEDDTGIPTRYYSPPGRKKHLTGRQLQFSKDANPLAGSLWFERMKADHKADIIKEVKSVVGVK